MLKFYRDLISHEFCLQLQVKLFHELTFVLSSVQKMKINTT